MRVIDNLSEAPGVCAGLSVFFFLAGYAIACGILDSLLKMHRSRSAVKKIRKEYTLGQKLWFVPHEASCIHAVKFCRKLICFVRIRSAVFPLCLLLGVAALFGLPVDRIIAWACAVFFLCFDAPLFLLHLLLARPLIGRFRGFSFEKYHNTADHESIL